jgi:hypothetical protein
MTYDEPIEASLSGLVLVPLPQFGARSLLDSNLAKEARPGPGTYPLQGSIGNQVRCPANLFLLIIEADAVYAVAAA